MRKAPVSMPIRIFERRKSFLGGESGWALCAMVGLWLTLATSPVAARAENTPPPANQEPEAQAMQSGEGEPAAGEAPAGAEPAASSHEESTESVLDGPIEPEEPANPDQVGAIETYPESIPVAAKPEAAPPPPKEQQTPRGIEEITVTATKREESVRALASSVSALSGKDMESLGLRDVDDIVNQVPGVNIWDLQNGTTPKRITVRGISAELGTAATTGVFLDETPFNDPVAPLSVLDMNPFDLYSVEVLKGPVGTLFGGSGLNGAIRYIPAPPVFGEWQAKFFGEVGMIHEGGISRTYGGAVNVPLFGRDDLALRLVATDRHSAGYMDSVHSQYMKKDINNTDQKSARVLLGWQPLEKLSLTAMYATQETEVDDVLRFTEHSDGTLERRVTPRPSPSLNSYDIYNLKGKWEFDWADLVFNVARLDKVGKVEADFSYLAQRNGQTEPLPTTFVTADYDGTSNVQELRLVSNDDGGNWDWLIGAFNYSYDVKPLAGLEVGNKLLRTVLGPIGPILNSIPGLSNVLLDNEGDVQVLVVRGDYAVTEQALFGEVNWRFAEDFQLTAGLRAYRFSYDIFQETKGAGCVLADLACPLNLFTATSHPKADENGLNPKLSLKWQASDNIMSYATLSKGYRFGGVNSIPHPDSPPSFKSDSLWNLEVGFRGEWFDRSLITDLSVYAIRWSDAQVSITATDLPVTYVDNVGEVQGRGVEAQLIWLTPLTGLRLSFMPAYTDIRTASPFITGSGQELPEGTRWPLSPRLQTSTAVSWQGTLFHNNQFEATLTHRYSAKTAQQLTSPHAKVFGFSTYSFQLTWKRLDAGYLPEVSFNLNNITDVRGVSFLNQPPPGSVPDLGTLTGYIEPRNATLRLTFNF